MAMLQDGAIGTRKFLLPSGAVPPAGQRSTPTFSRRARSTAKATSAFENWQTRSEKWGSLMVAAQGGERQAYDQLLKELDRWLRRYYAQRLPPDSADDARQDALLAIHSNRYSYVPSKPFGPWVAAIARYKWIDHIRDASRFATLSLDEETPIAGDPESAVITIAVDDLLSRLKPAQAQVIRLVKIYGASINDASNATGQSISLVKINIHRGLKKLAALTAGVADGYICAPAKDV
jgi:RNA polymerase sigma factor (sigma-70 family)